jgi:glycosyltransferase involved in cell wall biosynthesis
VQLAGRAEKRFGELVEFCSTDPADVARAIESTEERSDEENGTETSLREFAGRFDWSRVASDYEQALEDVL